MPRQSWESLTQNLPKAPKPVGPDYAPRERPLSYQPVFYEVDKQPLNNYGYPEPGIQSPTAKQVTAKDYLISDDTWEDLCDKADLDFIVIGSGFTALAFIDETLKLDPFKKIVCLERGDFWLPDHFQNLPLPFKYTLGGPSETFPFTLSRETYASDIKFVHGSTPFFGGRSTFWSAWSPSPKRDLMRGWPESLIKTSEKEEFFKKASDLLRVTPANKIGPPYEKLQLQVDARLIEGVKDKKIPHSDEAYSAPMAVSSMAQTSTIRFTKFSTPGPLLGLYKQQQARAQKNPPEGSTLLFAVDTAVEYLVTDVGYPAPPTQMGKDKKVKFVRSSRHTDLPVQPGRTKIILCAGAFPNATLVLNSFPEMKAPGQTVTGHFLSHIVGRVKRSAFKDLNQKSIEIGASYLAGKHPKSHLQYHIQVTAITSPDPAQDAEDAARFCPDYAAAASQEQLSGDSNQYVIFVCATLGETSEHNKDSFFKRNENNASKDPTANCVLQMVLNKDDYALWDIMDEATFKAIEVMAGEGNEIQWWHQPKRSTDPKEWRWESKRPGHETIRMEGIVHEAGLLPVGPDSDPKACVDENYKLKGVENVYVTGGAIFPTSGSWNPTLTMCGYAQDLARKLTPERHSGRPAGQ